MTGDLETRLRRYGEIFERVVDAYPDDIIADEIVLGVRQRVTRRRADGRCDRGLSRGGAGDRRLARLRP